MRTTAMSVATAFKFVTSGAWGPGVFWTPLFFSFVSVHEEMTCCLVCRKVLTCCLVCRKVLRNSSFESSHRVSPRVGRNLESRRYTTHILHCYPCQAKIRVSASSWLESNSGNAVAIVPQLSKIMSKIWDSLVGINWSNDLNLDKEI